jgi:hypothetical protein
MGLGSEANTKYHLVGLEAASEVLEFEVRRTAIKSVRDLVRNSRGLLPPVLSLAEEKMDSFLTIHAKASTLCN